MPDYDYLCESEACGHEQSEFRFMAQRYDPLPCPQCQGPMGLRVAKPTPKIVAAPEPKEAQPHSYGYLCEGCKHEDFERRMPDQKDDPLECPQCQGAMTRKFETPTTVNIIDKKTLNIPGRAPIHKSRKRQLGSGLGRIEPLKIAHEMDKLEQKYEKDFNKTEAALEAKNKLVRP